MKLITAIVKPHAVQAIHQAIESAGQRGMTVTDAQGMGVQRGPTEIYRGAELDTEFVAKAKIEIIAADRMVDRLCELIVAAARTGDGTVGDGKIWVTEVARVIRVRTGEVNDAAV